MEQLGERYEGTKLTMNASAFGPEGLIFSGCTERRWDYGRLTNIGHYLGQDIEGGFQDLKICRRCFEEEATCNGKQHRQTKE